MIRTFLLICIDLFLLLYTTPNHSYSQEFPRRFQKDIVKAATEMSRHQPWSSSISWLHVPAVSVEGLEHVLENIGASHLMSRSELDGIFREIGTCPISDKTDGDVQEGQCVISENQMLDLISKNWEEHHAPLM